MKAIKTLLLISILSLFVISCAEESAKPEKSEGEVVFKGRTIDLKPYFEGFPYLEFMPVYKAGKIFYQKEDSTRMLMMLDFPGDLNLEKGKVISDIDFSKRNVWSMKYNKRDGMLYWNGDEVNDEVMNVYRLNMTNQKVEKLTDNEYNYGYGFNEPNTRAIVITRLGTKEDRLGEVQLIDLESGKTSILVQDTPEFRFTWGNPAFSPDEKFVLVPALQNADRNYGNIMMINTETRDAKPLLTKDVTRHNAEPYSEWLSGTQFIYTSNESGYNNLYKYDIANTKSEQITNFDIDLHGYELIEIDDEKFIFAVTSNPIETMLYLINPKTGEIINTKSTDENVDILDAFMNKIMAKRSSASTFFRIDEITVSKDDFAFETVIEPDPEFTKSIMHADVERIEYPTFDTLDNGEPRMIHAYLYKPKNPLPEGEGLVMIQSFYGGYNDYHPRTQILTEAGIYVLSPAPRGSRLFGKEFYALNDKDLGGNEIIDVIYAGKYISEKLNIPSSHIGVYGGSHGGYATMRLLSFPSEINGNVADFDFGFGMSHAGFSDIIHFYETCNIPDWVLLEAGDPATEADKLISRSPRYNAKDFTGTLLLTHGTNDSRVPIEGSRWMADSLKKYDKSYQLVEFEGQGHSIKGLDNQVRFYSTWFDFLESLDK